MPPQIGEGIGKAIARANGSQEPEQSAEERVQELLATLDLPTPEAPPKIGLGRNILGGVGDALTAMAAVKAGGAPPRIGQFAATKAARLTNFENRTAEAEAGRRDLSNRLRIREFERGEDRIFAEKQRKLADEAAVAKREADFEGNIRAALIDKAVALGIDFKGKSIAEVTIPELQDALSKHDPFAAVVAALGALPEGFSSSGFRINKDGSHSIDFKAAGSSKKPELPGGLLETLVERGEENLSQFFDDKETGKKVEAAATYFRGQAKQALAGELLEDIDRFYEDNSFDDFNNPNSVNIGLAAATKQLRKFNAEKASTETVQKYYEGEVRETLALVEETIFTQDEAEDYLQQLRSAIRTGFDIPLPALAFPNIPGLIPPDLGGEKGKKTP